MEMLLAILTGVIYSGAFYLMLRRSLVKLIIGLVLLGYASNLMIFTLGRLSKYNPPFIPEGSEVITGAHSDPLPQALILTAIVIGFGIQAFAIVLIKRAYQETGNEDLDSFISTDIPESKK